MVCIQLYSLEKWNILTQYMRLTLMGSAASENQKLSLSLDEYLLIALPLYN